MPSHINAIPKYRKHKGSGQAVVTIGGVDYYLGPYGTKASRLEYDRLIGEWIIAGRPSSIVKAADLTIAELCQRYKRYTESYYIHGGMLHNIGAACRTLRLRLCSRTRLNQSNYNLNTGIIPGGTSLTLLFPRGLV
jgi:hypothetical protein